MRAQIDEVRVWVSQSWAETDWPAAHRAFHWRLFDCTKLILLCIVLPAFTHSFIALRINLTHSSFSSLLTKQNHCHLLGSLNDWPGSWVAVSIWNGTLNGVVSAFNETFYVHFDGPKGKHLLFKGSHLKIDKKCGKTSYFTLFSLFCFAEWKSVSGFCWSKSKQFKVLTTHLSSLLKMDDSRSSSSSSI